MDTIRFGVIGLRRGQSFVRVCRTLRPPNADSPMYTGGGATVTALYDVDPARVQEAAAENEAQGFVDFEAFLNSDIDAVVVASPIAYHASQAVAALGAGKHVLSEVTACCTLDEARALVEAARASGAVYMMAENYRYLDEVELIKRLHDDGRFGDAYYGEGEYVHDCRDLWRDKDGQLTWRGRGGLSVYCTHSLGPLLYVTGDRVASVSDLAVPGGQLDPAVTFPTMHLMQMLTVGGVTLRVRVDHVSPRPHRMSYYALQGTRGSYESGHGDGDAGRVWLEDEHEQSLFYAPAEWHALSDQASRYIPERLAAPAEARSGGHGTSEYWLLRDFLSAVRGQIPPPVDVYRSLDYTLPGIYAVESAAAGGAPVTVDDPRSW